MPRVGPLKAAVTDSIDETLALNATPLVEPKILFSEDFEWMLDFIKDSVSDKLNLVSVDNKEISFRITGK